ncbi:hypothetical protein GGS23DRAFT_604380 [Durotheca rogersii]|uniref:uncharacterized protein n=1 Tax=Durotheca rogersii TaxID=419775 RepID=UPI0022212235|nr:uncharacterized protein GGS23DRAFT_604380 [Durotheca rogersii]KAI5864936.1 hypothetical protein GGS23DRAFT_604380 [Durotheca rogersii]
MENPTRSDSWQHAVQSFVSGLGPAERAGFRAPASPDDCMAVLLATQRRKTKLARILDLMRPAIDPLKRFESAIDVVVQVNAGIASPIWGPLRVVVTLCADHFHTLESVAMIIHRVISSLQRFSKYEELFAKNDLVQNAIGALYCDYLDFCVRVTRFYSSPFRSFFSSFEKDFGDVAASIKLHSKNVDWAAHAAHVEETQREMEKAKLERRAHERGNIQRWLSPSTVDDDLRKHAGECLAGSCDGILASPQLKALVAPGDTPKKGVAIRLQGLPGSGKTTAAAFLINHLKNQGFVVLYFFFKASDGEKCSLLNCLRTLLSQLIRSEEGLYDFVEPLYQMSGRVVADSLIEVRQALSTALEHAAASRIFLVLDALDEASNSEDVLKWVAGRREATGRRLRVVCTSRPSWTPAIPVPSDWMLLRMEDFKADSIKQYILDRVRENPVISGAGAEKQVADMVASAAGGLWLYARLTTDDLDRLPSIGQVWRQLTTLPQGFTELYSQILRTTETKLSAVELKLAQQLHLWVDVDDYLPKFLILADDRLRYDTLELIFQYANDGEPVYDPLAVASRVSAPLLRVFGGNSDYDREDDASIGMDTGQQAGSSSRAYELDFIHQTAAQYLSESDKLPAAQLPRTLQLRRLRCLHRAAVAVWYFTECEQSARVLADLRRSDVRPRHSLICYFEMAYGLWDALRLDGRRWSSLAAQNEEDADATAVLRTLARFISTPACLRWVECAIIINYRGNFPHLLWNAVDAWSAGVEAEGYAADEGGGTGATAADPYRTFSRARTRFCQNYAFVLALTGVGGSYAPLELLNAARRDFAQDRLAQEILKLGQRWRPLVVAGEGEMEIDNL